MTNQQVKFPEDPGYFDERVLVEVISEYDIPLIYTFYSKTNDFFLGYFCENREAESVWLFVPTDPARLRKLYRNECSIQDFLKISNSIYLTEIDHHSGKVKGSSQHKLFNEIPAAYIPHSSIFLDRVSAELSVRLVKPGLNPFTAPERLVTELVQDLRKGLRAIMREVKDRMPNFENISIPESLFGLPSINPGSLELILKPSNPNPLFEKSFEAISKVISGTDADYLDDDLRNTIKRNLVVFCPKGRRAYNFESISITGQLPKDETLEMSAIDFSLTIMETNRFREETRNMDQQERTLVLKGKVQGFNSEFLELELDQNELGIEKLKCNFDMDNLIECLRQDASMSLTNERLEKPGQVIIHERVEVTCDYSPKARYANMRRLVLEPRRADSHEENALEE